MAELENVYSHYEASMKKKETNEATSSDSEEKSGYSKEPNDTGDPVSNPNSTDQPKRGKGKREKKQCPLPECGNWVIHLPRHMRKRHKWEPEKARAVVSAYGKRKPHQFKTVKSKDYHHHKKCPIKNCLKVVKRLPNHLRSFHRLKGSDLSDALLTAREPVNKKVGKMEERRGSATKTDSSCESSDDANDSGELSAVFSDSETSQYDQPQVTAGPRKILSGNMKSFNEAEVDSDCDEVGSLNSNNNTSESEKVDVCKKIDVPSPEYCEKPAVADCELNSDTEDVEYDSDTDAFDVDYDSGSENDEEVSLSSPLRNSASERIINKFLIWIQSADGGLKNVKSATQHARQVSVMLHAVDENENILCLLDKSLLLNKFLEQHAKENNYTPNTIKSYLMSARHFCKFLLSYENALDRELSVEEKQRIDSMCYTFKTWSTSYRKLTNKRMLDRMDQDFENLVTPEKVTQFEQSATAREAVKILGELTNDSHDIEITQTAFVTVRDYLMTQIVLSNANRSGVLANLTVDEFNKGMNIKQNDHYVVRVKDHKTASTHGPARLVLNEALYSWLDIYERKLRTKLSSTSNAFFLSWNGKPLISGHVSRAIRASWKRAGLDDPIHCTLMRKSAVSQVHTNHNEMSVELADLMTHRVETARKYYRLADKQRSAVYASQKLSTIMRKPAEKGQVPCEEKNEDYIDQGSGSSTSKKILQWRESEEEEVYDHEVKSDFAEKSDASLKTVQQKVVSSNTRTTFGECAVLTFVSDDNFANGKRKTQPTVSPETEKCKRGLGLSVDALSAASTSSTTSGYVFSRDETNVLHTVFKDMIKGSAPILSELI